MARKELNLDGGEISIIKALGLGGTEIRGDDLLDRVQDLDENELIETIKGLIAVGYVNADRGSFYDKEDLKNVLFQVNSGYSKDLREAIDPSPEQRKSRRVRRE